MNNLGRHVLQVASISLAIALGSAAAVAQGVVPNTPTTGQTGTATGGTGGRVGGTVGTGVTAAAPVNTNPVYANWTAETVSPSQPFGAIDIATAGTTPTAVWVNNRTFAERAELTGRCNVINNQANANRYDTNAKTFCRNYMTAQNTK
jgi:hypothetical protein